MEMHYQIRAVVEQVPLQDYVLSTTAQNAFSRWLDLLNERCGSMPADIAVVSVRKVRMDDLWTYVDETETVQQSPKYYRANFNLAQGATRQLDKGGDSFLQACLFNDACTVQDAIADAECEGMLNEMLPRISTAASVAVQMGHIDTFDALLDQTPRIYEYLSARDVFAALETRPKWTHEFSDAVEDARSTWNAEKNPDQRMRG